MTPLDHKAQPPARGAQAADRIRTLVQRAHGGDTPFERADAVRAADPADVAAVVFAQLSTEAEMTPLATGVAASPGAASGRLVTSAEAAMDAADDGEEVILARPETGPEDVLGMRAACAIITARGGTASHAAVVARGWGLPAVVGVSTLTVHDDGIEIDGHRIPVGEHLSVDGSSGRIYSGASALTAQSACPELDELLGWADSIRAGRIRVRANADDEASALNARKLGADGIGLCRTEHMFFAADRLPLIRQLILDDTNRPDTEVLEALQGFQRSDFRALLTAMDGLPVCVRLLDPPLHEFLPDPEPLIVAKAQGRLDAAGQQTLSAVRQLQESNPMMGTRGVRLGVTKPWIYEMQLRALHEAVVELRERGADPRVEVMIPLVINSAELVLVRSWVDAIFAGTPVRVGSMIETPSAAITAGSLAPHVDFFSFGTNDLTQLTMGLSRDDVEVALLPAYLERGLLAHNPFVELDRDAVGPLIRDSVADIRSSARPISVGVCGEQAADPGSIQYLVGCGVDYVSCSPHRLLQARLAAAQALLADDEVAQN